MRYCEPCQDEDTLSKAVEVVWRHWMHNSRRCGYIRVCQKCLDNGEWDDLDPDCPSCSLFYETDRQLTRECLIR